MKQQFRAKIVAPVMPAKALATLALLALGAGALGGCGPNDFVDRNDALATARGPASAGADPAQGGQSGGATGGAAGAMGAPAAPVSAVDAGPPPAPISCGEITAWVPDGMYKEGTKVAAGRPAHIFECRPWPNSGWCPFVAYEPAKPDGPWADAWNDVGPCP